MWRGGQIGEYLDDSSWKRLEGWLKGGKKSAKICLEQGYLDRMANKFLHIPGLLLTASDRKPPIVTETNKGLFVK